MARAPGGRGGPRLRLRGRPAAAEAVHRRPGPGARRRRRRRRRPARRGLTPDIVVVGEDGLARGAGAVQSRHGLRQGAAQGPRGRRARRRLRPRSSAPTGSNGWGSAPSAIAASGTSEDIALLIADVEGASLIVTVGTHATLDEFLDRQRSGLASTFLTRLRVGPRLVDAKAVPVLYAGRLRAWHLALLLLAGLLVLGAAIAATPVGSEWWQDLEDALEPAWDWAQGLVT